MNTVIKNKYLKWEDAIVNLKLIREFDKVSGSKIVIKIFLLFAI